MQQHQQQITIKDLPSSLTIKTQQKNNRSLVTRTKIPKNKLLFECQPIATAILSKMRDKVCDNCLLVVNQHTVVVGKQLSKCGACGFVYYCSRQCQKSGWKIHKEQCAIFKNIMEVKKIKSKNIMAQFVLNLRIWILRHNSQQINHKISQMVNLIQYQPLQKTQKFQQLSATLLQNLNLHKSQQNLTKLIQQISTLYLNCFTIQDYLCSQQSIGIGIYYPCNFINSSCQPNCQQIFQGNILKIRTLKNIEKQEEVCICYVGRLGDYDERRSLLKEGYLFSCFCVRCQVQRMYDWSVFYVLCPGCGKRGLIRKGYGKMSQKQLIQDGLIQGKQQQQQEQQQSNKKQQIKSNKQIQCQNCSHIVPQQHLQQLLQQIQKHTNQIMNPDNSYKIVKKQFFALKKILSYTFPKYQQLLNRVYLKCLGEAQQYGQTEQSVKLYEQAYILLKDLIENVYKWYQIVEDQEEIPYFYGWKYAELGKLAYLLSNYPKKKNKIMKAAEYTQKAYQILKNVNFSKNLLQVRQLQKRNQQIKIAMSFRKTEVFSKK